MYKVTYIDEVNRIPFTPPNVYKVTYLDDEVNRIPFTPPKVYKVTFLDEVNRMPFTPPKVNKVTYLDEVNRIPFTPPNVERDTNIGMITHMKPYSLLANICKSKEVDLSNVIKEGIW